MNYLESQRVTIARALIIAAALMFGNSSFADVFPFRVAFANVPGVAEIEAGNIPAGIKVLESQLNQTEPEIKGDILATLCAAHIVNMSLDRASRTCNEAADVYPSNTAYNNRGVYRAFTGDLSGAREDFERVRPRELDAYLEELKTKDVGLISIDNFNLIEELSAKHTADEITASVAMSAAVLEDVND